MLFLLFSLVLICSAVESKDYTIVVETSDDDFSGTDAIIKIRVYGTITNINAREIKGSFETGDTDTIHIQNYDIGYVTGMAVYRNNDGIAPDWRLDRITIKISGKVDSIFNYNGWVSKRSWTELTLSCPIGYTVNSKGYCVGCGSLLNNRILKSPGYPNSYPNNMHCVYDVPIPDGMAMNVAFDFFEVEDHHSCGFDYLSISSDDAFHKYCGDKTGQSVKITGDNAKITFHSDSSVMKRGFSLTFVVADVDECQNPSSCISPATCTNTQGSYYCTCPSGYVFKTGSKKECEDIDECANNPCDSIKSTCENTAGDYKCNCKTGYKNLDAHTCINVNECSMGIDECNKFSSECVDTEGHYYCRCKPGFTQGASNKICVAINCGPLNVPAGSTLEPARCTQANANIYGDKCVMKCKDGYVIDDINHGVLTCKSSGKWEGNVGVCNPVACSALSSISNGNIFPQTCSSSGAIYTESCSYRCNSGYTILGQARRTCQADGTWDGAAPACKKLHCASSDSKPVGISDGRIANSSFNASSYYSNYPPWNARLNSGHEKAWYGRPWDVNSWIQVDLGTPTVVRAIATQGKRFTFYVKTYKLGYSDDGKSWTMCQENGQVKVFQGNSDAYHVAKRELKNIVKARFFRIYPQTWNHGSALKFELYTCTQLS